MKRMKWCFEHDSAWDGDDWCEKAVIEVLDDWLGNDPEEECRFGYVEIRRVGVERGIRYDIKIDGAIPPLDDSADVREAFEPARKAIAEVMKAAINRVEKRNK